MGQLGQVLEKIVERGDVSAAINTAVSRGSFGSALANSMISDLGMVGAGAIGVASTDNTSMLAAGSPGYVLAHAGLGCALSAAKGTGCARGAIGGAASAIVAPMVRDGLYNDTQTVTTTDNGDGTLTQTTSYNNTAFNAITAGIATLSGGLAAGLAGANAQAGATSAENEVLHNTLSDKVEQLKKWAQWTFANPAGDISRWIGQFGGLVQSGAQQTMSQSPWSLALQGVSNGLSAIFGVGGGLPPAAGADAVLVGSAVGKVAPAVAGTPPNATLSSSNSGESGSGSGNSSSAANNSADGVPGRVQSRINVTREGMGHIGDRHLDSTVNASQFTISEHDLTTLLQDPKTVSVPVTRTFPTNGGLNYVREVDTGRVIGTDKFNNYQPTSTMTVMTDKYGNLVTAFPGKLK